MANRFVKPTINWKELAERVAPDQKSNYMTFKAKADNYLRRVMANPPELPKINWDHYMKVVPDKCIVTNLKSKLEEFKVPYPEATSIYKSIDQQAEDMKKKIKDFEAEQGRDINAAQKELKRIDLLPKIEDMTMEMYHDMFPNQALNTVQRPSFWPHNKEEQPGYLTAEQKALKESGGHH